MTAVVSRPLWFQAKECGGISKIARDVFLEAWQTDGERLRLRGGGAGGVGKREKKMEGSSLLYLLTSLHSGLQPTPSAHTCLVS